MSDGIKSLYDRKECRYPVGDSEVRKKIKWILIEQEYPKDFMSFNNTIDRIENLINDEVQKINLTEGN